VELYPGIVSIRISIFLSADTVGCFSDLSNLQFRDFDINIAKDRNGIALDKIICEFISKQCSLQSFRIDCSVENETILKLLRNLNDLTCLDLSKSTPIDGSVFMALPELSKLTALHLSYTYVNDEGLKNIATKAPHLKTLKLKDCKLFSDIGIRYIADGCHCLEHLVIYNHCLSDNVRIFRSTLETIGKGCPKLKHLAIGCCPVLDDSGIIA
jgi:F-box/leucine-rich repeat protein 2/20